MHLQTVAELDVADLGGQPTRDRDLRSRGRQTVSRLLWAGHEVVEERGHDNARVDDIVDRAEVSHGTFYLYFKDREDLLASLVRLVRASVEPLAKALPAGDDRAGLARWFEQAEVAFDRHVEVLRAAQALGDDGAVDVLVRELAGTLEEAGGRDASLVARMLMEHFARAIVRADIIDGDELAAVALRAAGIEAARSAPVRRVPASSGRAAAG